MSASHSSDAVTASGLAPPGGIACGYREVAGNPSGIALRITAWGSRRGAHGVGLTAWGSRRGASALLECALDPVSAQLSARVRVRPGERAIRRRDAPRKRRPMSAWGRFILAERETRFELATSTLARLHSTTELLPQSTEGTGPSGGRGLYIGAALSVKQFCGFTDAFWRSERLQTCWVYSPSSAADSATLRPNRPGQRGTASPAGECPLKRARRRAAAARPAHMAGRDEA